MAHFPIELLLGKGKEREIITAMRILLLLMKFNKQTKKKVKIYLYIIYIFDFSCRFCSSDPNIPISLEKFRAWGRRAKQRVNS